MSCIFCKIASKEIPTPLIYEDEEIVAFKDLGPQAPHHILIIPRKHYANLNALKDDEFALPGKMMLAAKKIAHQLGVAEKGYRLNLNCNSEGGQTVYHIHLHLLAGRQMHWPPG